MNNIKPCCRVCRSSSDNQKVRANYVYGGNSEHKFYHCNNCDLVYLWPVPSMDEEREFYKKDFEEFMEDRSSSERNWSTPEKHIETNKDNVIRRFGFLERFLLNGRRVLEIGCSSGFMLDAFSDCGMNVVGVEPSGVFWNFLNKKGYEIYSSIPELILSKPKIKFDLIVHFFVLEHIRDTKEFITEQINLLNDDGAIVIEVPCVNDPLTSLYSVPEFEQFYWSIAHHYYFSPKSISYILDKIPCNYNIVPEQRYDLSNHMVWMQEGKPGGQGLYDKVFLPEMTELYKKSLKDSWNCDTMFIYITKN